MILNLIFEAVHRMFKEAEDFATMVKVAGKNLCSYVSLIKFLKNSVAEWLRMNEDDLKKMQYDLFDINKADVLRTPLKIKNSDW